MFVYVHVIIQFKITIRVSRQQQDMKKTLHPSQITLDDLSQDAKKQPDESKEKVLLRVKDFLNQIKRRWGLKGVSAARAYVVQQVYFQTMVSKQKYDSVIKVFENAQMDIENQNNNKGNDPRKGEKKSQTQWLWWIIFIISACILAYLVYHFGLCGTLVSFFKWTYEYATEIIGFCLAPLIATASYCFSSVLNWFIGLFK